jgi:hypothetical protein
LLEKYYEYGREVHLCFVDFKQAYDSIIRRKLWAALKEFGIPAKLIQLIKECNTKTKYGVKFANILSESQGWLKIGRCAFSSTFQFDFRKSNKISPC